MKRSTNLKDILGRLASLSSPEVAKATQRFFDTSPTGYAAHDVFIGIRTPQLRKLARHYREVSQDTLEGLLQSTPHEARALALMIMVEKYNHSKLETNKEQLFQLYCRNLCHINNWDLVDISAPHLVGKHLQQGEKNIVEQWATHENLWVRRIAVVACRPWIQAGDFQTFETVLQILHTDPHHLIGKALGWMLREVGKVNQAHLLQLLHSYAPRLAAVTLSYATEHLTSSNREQLRQLRKKSTH